KGWYRERFKPGTPSPNGGLTRFFNIEAPWLALNSRFELTDTQFTTLSGAVRTAAGDRDKIFKVIADTGDEGDFTELLMALGRIQATLDKAMSRQLTLRELRFMQEWKRSQASPIRPRMLDARARPPRGNAAFIYTDPQTGRTEVFDFVHITERSAGYKVRFQKDQPLRGMNTVNVIFEKKDRFVMAEPLAFELYRRLGNAACQTDFVRLTLNGHPLGYHLLFEQVNGSFLDRNQVEPGGELYKILWYGLGIEGQHEKQDHPDRDHADLVKLIASLNATTGAAQWEVIQNNFNVDQVATYFAVNMVLSHWDGFFNNYFTYHDRKGSGKWEMYPWDQDHTWGAHDPSGDEVFFDLPVTFGMAGDRPPGGGIEWGPKHWWRPGGFFSAPLLANPEFRKRFLARTRQILEETYTEQVFFPVIDAMAARLKPEIPLRAQAIGEEPAVALARLDKNVASLKEHLVKRRKFLLEQNEIASLEK
ncbi:MAG TPA: CotH kinase family protein, partial [Verrucomicrobiae bacterium]|nr:CotH kinase family protein [Verrucomicrobiae bacterium]